MGPLSGIRIVDLTSMLSGPWATMILADQGADVIKVEEPARGDHTRSLSNRHRGLSAQFLNLNRNKRSIAIDPRILPLGAPVFLAATWPGDGKPLRRLAPLGPGPALRGSLPAGGAAAPRPDRAARGAPRDAEHGGDARGVEVAGAASTGAAATNGAACVA